jgi:hypothetical protein
VDKRGKQARNAVELAPASRNVQLKAPFLLVLHVLNRMPKKLADGELLVRDFLFFFFSASTSIDEKNYETPTS